jgi:hypothetical protein
MPIYLRFFEVDDKNLEIVSVVRSNNS